MELGCQRVGEVGPAVELGRGVLEVRDLPAASRPDGDQRLDCVDGWVEFAAARRHHPADRADNSHVVAELALGLRLSDVGGGLMISEDLAQGGLDLAPAMHLAAIEPDGVAVVGKQRRIASWVTPIP